MARIKLSTEAKVGLFVFIGILILAYMSLRLGGFQFAREEGIALVVKLDSAAGLDQDASVRIAGVEVGRVKKIELEDNKAKLILQLRPNVKVRRDFTAVLKTKGLLGERYLDLIPGAPDAPVLKQGEEITRVETYIDMDRLLTILGEASEDIKQVSATLSSVLGGKEGEVTLRNIVTNLEDITTVTNRVIQEHEEKLARILTNIDAFSESLRDDTPRVTKGLIEVTENLNQVINENRGNLKAGVENLKVATAKLEEAMDTVKMVSADVGPKISDTATVIEDAVKNIKDATATIGDTAATMGSVAEKLDKGEGTLAKLINEPTVHENLSTTLEGVSKVIKKSEEFRFFVGYRGEYLFDEQHVKSYFSLKIQPKADKYYLFEVVDDPRGHVETEEVERVVDGVPQTIEETKISDEIEFSAQIAKRFKNITLRGGLIESTGGVGVDYHLFEDRLKFTLEAFDFDEERNPHLKFGATYNLNRFFFLTAGYDDFISRVDLESVFFGIGFRFEDDDLKYLFTNAPPISF
jgi:phospholipid/cholesterol/gamma-HCH transport system substrate-binding protein